MMNKNLLVKLGKMKKIFNREANMVQVEVDLSSPFLPYRPALIDYHFSFPNYSVFHREDPNIFVFQPYNPKLFRVNLYFFFFEIMKTFTNVKEVKKHNKMTHLATHKTGPCKNTPNPCIIISRKEIMNVITVKSNDADPIWLKESVVIFFLFHPPPLHKGNHGCATHFDRNS